MAIRSIEIKEIIFEVEQDRLEEVVRKIKELYPNLEIKVEGNKVTVSGNLRNYKRRDMLVWILTGGKHGQAIPPN